MSCRVLPLVVIAAVSGFASDWPRFRGPNGDGVSPDKGLPSEIAKDRNVLWKAETLEGHSSPVIAADRLWITGHEGDQRSLLCFSARDGALLWRKDVAKAYTETANPLNGPTTPTPAFGDNSVFVYFPEFGLLAYDLKGNERWRVPLGPFGGVQGMAVSPIYAEGLVLLLIDTPESAFLAAYDAKTGKLSWKAERPIGFLGSYSTPTIYRPPKGPAQVIVAGAVELTGYQLKTGERLWWARGVTYGPAVSPLITGDTVFTLEPADGASPPFKIMLGEFDKDKNGAIELSELSGDSVNHKIMLRLFRSMDKNIGNGDGSVNEAEYQKAFTPEPTGGLVRTRLDGRGDVTATHIGWRHTKGLPYVTSPVLYDGLLYVIRNGGILSVFDPESGKLLREERLKEALGAYYAQPVAGDGKLYFINQDGKATVIRAGEQWQILASGDLGEQVIATPAIAGSRIFVRTKKTLYCFGSSAAKGD